MSEEKKMFSNTEDLIKESIEAYKEARTEDKRSREKKKEEVRLFRAKNLRKQLIRGLNFDPELIFPGFIESGAEALVVGHVELFLDRQNHWLKARALCPSCQDMIVIGNAYNLEMLGEVFSPEFSIPDHECDIRQINKGLKKEPPPPKPEPKPEPKVDPRIELFDRLVEIMAEYYGITIGSY